MATQPCPKTNQFMQNGTPAQFEWILSHYDKILRAKAESKSQKPENIIKLDKWYQNELPKKIKNRPEPHIIYEEIVQTIKWKLSRGKFRPSLTNLVQMNTPRVVMHETKKAFRCLFKKNDLQSAVTAMCNLKGVGPAMASAVLAAGAPHMVPFMADEVLLSMTDVDSLDHTCKEYYRMVDELENCVTRLNKEQSTEPTDDNAFTLHKTEMAIWCHYVANSLLPELVDEMPVASSSSSKGNSCPAVDDQSDRIVVNGAITDTNEDDNNNTTTTTTTSTNKTNDDDASNDSAVLTAGDEDDDDGGKEVGYVANGHPATDPDSTEASTSDDQKCDVATSNENSSQSTDSIMAEKLTPIDSIQNGESVKRKESSSIESSEHLVKRVKTVEDDKNEDEEPAKVVTDNDEAVQPAVKLSTSPAPPSCTPTESNNGSSGLVANNLAPEIQT